MVTKPKQPRLPAVSQTQKLLFQQRPSRRQSSSRLREPIRYPGLALEHPEFEVVEVASGPEVHYEIKGKLNTPVRRSANRNI